MLLVALKYAAAFLAGLAVAWLLTPLLAAAARRWGIFLDTPDERRLHREPTARCGGLAVFAGFHVACAVVFLVPWNPSFAGDLNYDWWQIVLVVSSLVLVVGLIDDYRGLNWLLKLFAQVTVGLLMYSIGIQVSHVLGLQLPEYLNLLLTIFWFVALMNAFNLIDGLDGLAAGLAIVAALGLAAMSAYLRAPADTLVLLGLVGACVGFLYYNFHPASIFLGDSGSMLLGFLLAVISLSTGTKTTLIASVGVPLLAVGVPIFDVMLAVWRRGVRSALRYFEQTPGVGGLVRADMQHLHHRLVHSGLTQRGVAMWLYGANALLVTIGLTSLFSSSLSVGLLLIAMVLGMYVIVRHIAHVELWDSGRLVLAGLRRPSSPVIAAILYPLCDLAALGAALAVMLSVAGMTGAYGTLKEDWLAGLPLWVMLPFIALVLAGTYQRVWSRARTAEFALTAAALSGGIVVGMGFEILYTGAAGGEMLARVLIFYGVAATLVLGLRAFPRTVQDFMSVSQWRHHDGRRHNRVILIYGAGQSALVFLKHLTLDTERERQKDCVLGLLDDDPNLRKRTVHGYDVFGGLAELPDLVERHGVTEIVIAAALTERKRRLLQDFAAAHNLILREWVMEARLLPEVEEKTGADDASVNFSHA